MKSKIPAAFPRAPRARAGRPFTWSPAPIGSGPVTGIVDEWIRIYEEENKPLPKPTAGKRYSGKFQLRPGSGLHELLAIRALQAGRSLNSYCVEVLREVAGERPS